MRHGHYLTLLLTLFLATTAPPAWSQCSDGDLDGTCDDVDACTNVDNITISNQFLRLRKVDQSSGTFATRIYYIGTFTGLNAASVDPLTNGIRLTITVPVVPEEEGITTIDVTLPPGAYDQAYDRGWAVDNGAFVYRDSRGSQLGIMRALVKPVESGSLKVWLFGQNGEFPLPLTMPPIQPYYDPFPLSDPIVATVVFDPPVARTGLCGEGILTECRYRNRGRKLMCN